MLGPLAFSQSPPTSEPSSASFLTSVGEVVVLSAGSQVAGRRSQVSADSSGFNQLRVTVLLAGAYYGDALSSRTQSHHNNSNCVSLSLPLCDPCCNLLSSTTPLLGMHGAWGARDRSHHDLSLFCRCSLNSGSSSGYYSFGYP